MKFVLAVFATFLAVAGASSDDTDPPPPDPSSRQGPLAAFGVPGAPQVVPPVSQVQPAPQYPPVYPPYDPFYQPQYYLPPYFPPQPPPRRRERGGRGGMSPLMLGILVALLAGRKSTTTSTAEPTASVAATTPDPFLGWKSHDGCRYQAFFDPKTHPDAKTACTEKGPDAEIAHTGFKTAADRILAANYAGLPEGASAWIGVEDPDTVVATEPVYTDGTTFGEAVVYLDGLSTAQASCGVYSLSYAPDYVAFGSCASLRYYICQVCP